LILLLALSGGMVLRGQSWSLMETHGEMDARVDNAFMACKGRFFMLGGRGIQPVDVFNPSTDTWTKAANPPVEMHHFQALRLGEEIWVLGAFTASYPNEKPLQNIYIYDTANDQWRKGDPIPTDRRRGSAGVVAYRGMIYLVGGTRDQYSGATTAMVDRYDPKTGKWKRLPDAPHARDHFHAGICNGKIYAVGGRQTNLSQRLKQDRTLAEVDVFDIESGKWKTLPEAQNLPTPRAGCSTATILDHILVIGGENMEQEAAYDVVEAYDVERGVWESWGKLNEGRQGTQAFMCVGTVFIASGSASREDGPILRTIEMLDY
jgi:N-acetylneuraminic acid mutarotase